MHTILIAASLQIAMAQEAPAGLETRDLEPGAGAPAAEGDVVEIAYEARLQDGTVFASSEKMGRAFTFALGAGQVIPGLEQGIVGMRPGGRREIVVPPALGYGDRGAGELVPPGSTLVFEVELVGVQAARRAPESPATVPSDAWVTTDSGLRYADLGSCEGEPPAPGSVVSVDYTGWVQGGERFDSSLMRERPLKVALGAGQVIAGWEEALALTPVGCRRQLVIPPELGYGQAGRGATIPGGSTLVFDIEVVGASEARRAPDAPAAVDDHLTTITGLKVADLSRGDGAMPEAGRTVAVEYTGFLEDGTRFDSTFGRAEPLRFQYGASEMIPGFEEGIRTMKVGGRRQLIIPPGLAYGAEGRPPTIPPGASLVFDVELVAVE